MSGPIPIAEFVDHLVVIQNVVKIHVPEVKVLINNGWVLLRTPFCSGRWGLDLEPTKEPRIPEAVVIGGGVSGTVDEVKKRLADYKRICDALDIANLYWKNEAVHS